MSLTTSRPVASAPATEEEFERWCTEDVRAEFVDGEVLEMSPVSAEHDELCLFLSSLLRVYLEIRPCGRLLGSEFQARLRPGLRRLPDLHFVATENLARIKRTYLEGAPDAVFEIVSPDSVERDWREKFLDYQAAGVREYWILDPAHEQARLHVLGEDGRYAPVEEHERRLGSRVIEGFWLKPEWLWQDPRPGVLPCLREIGVLA